MNIFKLTLFGGFHLADAQGQPITPSSRKAKALLAWLALTPDRQHPREKVAALFWPDSDEAQARHSLRQTLVELHRVMPEDTGAVCATRDWLLLDSQLLDIDTQAFNAALAQGDEEALDHAIELYQGELLEGCNPRSDMFNDWLENYRNDYSLKAATTLRQRLAVLLEQQDYERSLHCASRLVTIDPLQEAAYRGLMQAHAGLGDTASALRWYARCRDLLQQELGVTPSAETETLHKQLVSAADSRHASTTDQTTPPACGGCPPSTTKPDTSQRVLCLIKTALEGIVCNRLGHSFLIRGGNAHEKHKLVETILSAAKTRGFTCQRSEILPSGAGADAITAVQTSNSTEPRLLVVEHIHLAGIAALQTLASLISAAGNSSTLLVMTSRLEGEPLDPTWRGAMRGAPLTTIDL